MASFPVPSVRGIFRALATVVVPEAADLEEGAWVEVEAIIQRALESRPKSLQHQLTLLVYALEVLPLFSYGRTFQGLDSERRTAFLLRVQDAPLLLLRRGFWGLRTLIFMGYYGRADSRAEIGYGADPRGWEARR